MSSAPKARARLMPAVAIMLMTVWPCGFGIAFARAIPADGYLPILIVLTVPLVAAGLTMLALSIAPSLLPGGRIAWPANLTLPLVYIGMMIAFVALGTSTGNSLVLPNRPLGLAAFWLDPGTLIRVGLFQFANLTLLAALTRSKTPGSA